ncbi:hypothetical protein IFM58399_09165 [Aspergillus lentulus]|nr:uncharacterized protein IFM58399_09165 [Aspergillus lentulus]GFF51821.1 hypothetical protein IFM58399_09165 [Aspergillus lentulus]GFF76077.1 hypothetical protein IFM62136_09229 [Aspergillus lentulus]GFF87457.1 hypothetical protein IFM47457_07502 [Aspergillus lentulus]GFG12001.1 hypothetical protein IFM61392_07187 [Aspergillus lentulus]
MLDWISGQSNHVAHLADNSRVMDPPETPAPVFAIRAFKSALFGTPGAEDEEATDQNPKLDENPASRQQSKTDLLKPPVAYRATNVTKTDKTDLDMAVNATVSPTKSILMTPGTAANRRKTVSFGDGVIDNERKRNDAHAQSSRTPTNLSGNLSSQWLSSSTDSKGKPRSRLTQALLDSRDKSPNDSTTTNGQQVDPNPSTKPASKEALQSTKEDDETVNLDDPRSQSGKYWKAEFDSYRARTTNEIRKLIQYRSAAKKFALMKEAEASRLAKKLKEEEVKVAEMERHVTQLASTMVAENAKADREQLVQDLTKQTALALQYKHRVNTLRKLLEQHGVVGSEVDDIVEKRETNNSFNDTGQELLKTQQALSQANARIEEMKLQQVEFDKLKEVAQSSEQKASELARENLTLKQSLARVKQEMSKYEGRRKEKEAKLKQREIKLEARIQEYRNRLKTASQEHREMEEDLRESFNEERRRMQDQIDLLQLKVAAFERVPDRKIRNRHSYSPQKDYTGVQVYDFGRTLAQRDETEESQEIDEPPSPSPRSKDRRSRNLHNPVVDLDLRKAAQALSMEGINTRQMPFTDSPLKAPGRRSRRATVAAADQIPPSSPPELAPIDVSTEILAEKSKYNQHEYKTHLPTLTTLDSLARHLADRQEGQQYRTHRQKARRAPSKYSLDAISGLADLRVTEQTGKRHNLTGLQRDSIPVERMLAAQARLKRKDQSRKSKEGAKEFVKAYNT